MRVLYLHFTKWPQWPLIRPSLLLNPARNPHRGRSDPPPWCARLWFIALLNTTSELGGFDGRAMSMRHSAKRRVKERRLGEKIGFKVARAIIDWWARGDAPNPKPRCVSMTFVLSMRLLSHHIDTFASRYPLSISPALLLIPNASPWILVHISTCSTPSHLEQDEKLPLLLIIRFLRYLFSIHNLFTDAVKTLGCCPRTSYTSFTF